MHVLRLTLLASLVVAAHAQHLTSILLLLGATGTVSTKWDGSVEAEGAAVRVNTAQGNFEAKVSFSWTDNAVAAGKRSYY